MPLNDAGKRPEELKRLAAAGWEAIRGDNPPFDQCTSEFQSKLLADTADVLNHRSVGEFADAVWAADRAKPEPVAKPIEEIPETEPEPDIEPVPVKPKRGRFLKGR